MDLTPQIETYLLEFIYRMKRRYYNIRLDFWRACFVLARVLLMISIVLDDRAEERYRETVRNTPLP